MEIVTDPTKVVTDPLVLKRLAEQGVDPNYVEFWHDYAPRSKGKGYSPYAKFYRDLKGKRLMVASGLPMVDAYGFKHELAWRDKAGIIENGNNIFHAIIDKGTVRLIALSDQPTGVKKDSQVSYHPQLFIGKSEVQPQSLIPILLDTDPTNENYHYNVLEWDYGVCKRRIRIVEGRLRERWVFFSNPNADVRIKHNFAGRPVKLSGAFDARGLPLKTVIVKDEEIVPALEFAKALYPVQIGASATYYPDADEETSSVDGRVYYADDPETWDNIHDAATGSVADDDTDYLNSYVQTSVTEDKWNLFWRSLILIDASGLSDDAVITAATLTLYGFAACTGLGTNYLNIYASTPASSTEIITADYDQVGTTPFSTQIQTTNWNEGTPGDPNDFAFNADGRAAISKTIVSKFSLRAVCDAIDSEPTWVSNEMAGGVAWSADKGEGYKPKLVVNYYIAYTETASVAIGLVASASRAVTWERTSTKAIGLVASVSRLVTWERTASKAIGLVSSASRAVAWTRTATKAIGLVVTASRAVARHRTATVAIGLAVSAYAKTKLRRWLADFTGRALSSFTGRDLADPDEFKDLE